MGNSSSLDNVDKELEPDKQSSSRRDYMRAVFLTALATCSAFAATSAVTESRKQREASFNFLNYDNFPLNSVSLEDLDSEYEKAKQGVENSVSFNYDEPGLYRLEVDDTSSSYEQVIELSDDQNEYEVDLSSL